jgi:ketosteroid isomerase-like protein
MIKALSATATLALGGGPFSSISLGDESAKNQRHVSILPIRSKVRPMNIRTLITTSTVLVCLAAHAQQSSSRSATNDRAINAAQAPVAASSGVNKSDRIEASTEVAAAAAAIVAAFGRNDPQAYFTCFAPEATFIFHTTPRRLNSRAEYQAEWSKWVKEDGFRVRSCKSTDSRVQVLGDVAIFTHSVQTELSTKQGDSRVHERETIIFEHRDSNWIAVHEHLSPDPGKNAPAEK